MRRNDLTEKATPRYCIHVNPGLPRWVEELLQPEGPQHDPSDHDLRIQTSGPLAHATTVIRDAVKLDHLALRDRVALAYLSLIRALERLDRFPVRFWNYVPGIGEPMTAELDRYMVFNAGRHDAYTERYGARNSGNGHSLGTSSAVGITGSDLSIHCLAMDRPGTPIENPRQTPAWQYSARYGPLPPCFSRATIVPFRGRRHLLIGGTASVVGEDSRHPGELGAQLKETLSNIEVLVRVASCETGGSTPPLQRVVDLRVYITVSQDSDLVQHVLSQRCPHARTLDVVVAQVCRPELLVEVEGVAAL